MRGMCYKRQTAYFICFFCCSRKMYSALYELSVAEDSIWPEKYIIEGYPPVRDFPAQHPNKKQLDEQRKDEL